MIRSLLIVCIVLYCELLAANADVPSMIDESASSGIVHSYDGPWEYFVGGGMATLDCNQDRKPDVLIAGGASAARLFVNRSTVGGELKFESATLDIPERDLKKVLGAYPLDIDSDGFLDIVLLRVGRNILLRGEPDCRFRKANKRWNYDGGHAWTTAFSALFETGHEFPTLAFGNYVDRAAPGSPWGTCHDNELARPGSSESGNVDYSQVLPLSPGHCALSLLFTDWNKSGQLDLRVSNDRQYYRGGEEQLWHIATQRPPKLYTRAEGWERLTIWGMGIAEGDIDGDGFPEYALTSMGDTKLQTLDDEAEEDQPLYRDIAFARGATAHRPYVGNDFKPSTGWHAEFADFNNDAHLDLFIAKGNVEDMPDFAAYDPDNMLIGQFDGNFIEVGEHAGIALDRRGRGASATDFNADGLLDLIVVNRKSQPSVFRNVGARTEWGSRPMGNWLQLEIRQAGTNPYALGTTLAIKTGNLTQIRKIQSGGGHASGASGFIHVGLGVAERAEVRVRWPDNSWSAPFRVFANQFVIINRGNDRARYWYPG